MTLIAPPDPPDGEVPGLELHAARVAQVARPAAKSAVRRATTPPHMRFKDTYWKQNFQKVRLLSGF
jgi:hypothetical protein